MPNCFEVDVARVRFAPDEDARITVMGATSDGYCALDVEVPEGAVSGKVNVAIGEDEFESDVVFGLPCP